MEIRKLTDNLSVAGQIVKDDVETIAAEGFRTIICNRPDGEAAGQPDYGPIREQAENSDLNFVYMPVISGAATMQDVQDFARALTEHEGPILAYCRTGTRCTNIWALGEGARGTPVNEIVSAAASAGYDLSQLAPHIAAMGSR